MTYVSGFQRQASVHGPIDVQKGSLGGRG